MKRPSVLLADDHTLVLEGLRKLLEEDYDLVGTVETGRALVETAQRLDPDIIVTDISMPQLNGLDAVRQLKKLMPDSKVIFLTMHADPTYATEAFRAGAAGYLLKRSAASELIQAIEAVLKGQFYVTPLIAKDLLEPAIKPSDGQPSKREPATLTPRQREVLQLVAEGQSIKEIACTLNISIKTVEFHKSHIMDQLGLRTTAELTKYAIAHGLVSPE